ncbi:hypothetical protein HU200_051482 [Digitaria exilis]|uniref:Uncharacterized protein n=1 Tax=Digitaria exilis TaxID=1010633 RepID=A0A835B0B4_9POAL|nr:hypothetical protein HU200_051482 [Digitaria exilis]
MAMATVVRLTTGLLVLALLPTPVAGKGPWQRCGSTGKYTANSMYKANLTRLAKELPKNASSTSRQRSSRRAALAPSRTSCTRCSLSSPGPDVAAVCTATGAAFRAR